MNNKTLQPSYFGSGDPASDKHDHKISTILLNNALDEFQFLLHSPDSAEREWQGLFKKYPFILTDGLSLGISPEKLHPCKPGRAEADFYFYPDADHQTSSYGVIEIKRPNTRLIRQPRQGVVCLSASLTEAIAQARKYAWVEEQRQSQNILLLGNNIHIIVIAGLQREVLDKVNTSIERRLIECNLNDCRLVPYDLLYEYLSSKVPPRMCVAIPAYPGLKRRRDFDRTLHLFEPRRLHAAACGECGAEIEVPFIPTPGRAVFCRDCYDKRKKRRF